MFSNSNFLTLCSNWKQIESELNLSEDSLTDEKTLRSRLRLTYPLDRVNKTDTFTLVRDLERKGCYTPIDDGVLDIVLHLNRIGIRTMSCCEGHISDIHPAPFWGNLMYETPDMIPERLTEALRIFKRRKGFDVIYDTVCAKKRTNIRWCFHTQEEKEKRIQMLSQMLLKL